MNGRDAVVALVVVIAGCAAPAPRPDERLAPARDGALADRTLDEAPAGTVKASCPNYMAALQASLYPRDAIARGIHDGTAVVEFVIAGSVLKDVVIVSASDPVFAQAALQVVEKLSCQSTSPQRVRIPFRWHRG